MSKVLMGPPRANPRVYQIDKAVDRLREAAVELDLTTNPRSTRAKLKAFRKELFIFVAFGMEWQRYLNNAEDRMIKQKAGIVDV